MVWNWREQVVRLFTSSQKINLEFIDLFEETFSARLLPDGPLAAAQNKASGLAENQIEQLTSLEPCVFVDSETAFEALTEI